MPRRWFVAIKISGVRTPKAELWVEHDQLMSASEPNKLKPGLGGSSVFND